MKMHRKEQGFTIVELLIVIVVIGILAGLVITTFTGIQQKARNTERQTDIKAIYGQVEAYYAQNGKYPTLTNLNTRAWRVLNMKGLDSEAIKDPKGTGAGASTSDTAPYQLSATAGTNIYSYAVFAADGVTACDNSTTDCAVYTLTGTYEGGGSFAKTNLN
jgi:prepilin-type N-terminal cleavage/methylation domain-containing protein